MAAAAAMVDPDSEDVMVSDKEASLGCFKTTTPLHVCQEAAHAEANQEIKDEATAHPAVTGSNNSFREENSVVINHGNSRPLCHQEHWPWTNFHPDVQKVQQRQMKELEGHFYPVCRDHLFPSENRIQYMPLKMVSQGYLLNFPLQDFHYFVVIDFEATCDKERKPYPQEIIEFPSVIVNGVTGQLEASFQTYVRPAYHQNLTEFCKELTGIQQIQVDRGVPLNEAILMHDKWLEQKGIKHKNFAVVTWGNWDCRVMLDSECKFKSIQKPSYFDKWINLKVPFQDVFGGVQCNLKEAVQMAGLAWVGRPHCGLDDARNTARLLAILMRRSFKFSITNSLLGPHEDFPVPNLPFNNHPRELSQPPPQNLKEHLPGPYPTQFHPYGWGRCTYCFCGVMSRKRVIHKPGPMQGRCFFGCGNWSSWRPASCDYFMWDCA